VVSVLSSPFFYVHRLFGRFALVSATEEIRQRMLPWVVCPSWESQAHISVFPKSKKKNKRPIQSMCFSRWIFRWWAMGSVRPETYLLFRNHKILLLPENGLLSTKNNQNDNIISCSTRYMQNSTRILNLLSESSQLPWISSCLWKTDFDFFSFFSSATARDMTKLTSEKESTR